MLALSLMVIGALMAAWVPSNYNHGLFDVENEDMKVLTDAAKKKHRRVHHLRHHRHHHHHPGGARGHHHHAPGEKPVSGSEGQHSAGHGERVEERHHHRRGHHGQHGSGSSSGGSSQAHRHGHHHHGQHDRPPTAAPPPKTVDQEKWKIDVFEDVGPGIHTQEETEGGAPVEQEPLRVLASSTEAGDDFDPPVGTTGSAGAIPIATPAASTAGNAEDPTSSSEDELEFQRKQEEEHKEEAVFRWREAVKRHIRDNAHVLSIIHITKDVGCGVHFGRSASLHHTYHERCRLRGFWTGQRKM